MSARNRKKQDGTVAEYRPLAAYYTPQQDAEVLVRLLPFRRGEVLLEPHVGAGGFIYGVQAREDFGGLDLALYGTDLDPNAPALLAPPPGMAGVACRDSFGPLPEDWPRPDWILGNCAFGPGRGIMSAHVRRALEVVRPGGSVAFLLPLAFLGTEERYGLLQEHPPYRVWALSWRPSFTQDGNTDASVYGFFWWHTGWNGRNGETRLGNVFRKVDVGPPAELPVLPEPA